jgi:hypothetical protein
VTLPIGIHHDVAAADYHADPAESPSLSSSVAKIIVEKTPRHAWFAHPRLNPLWKNRENSAAAFDLGNVVHELMLGKGGGFEILDFPDYKTKAAQVARDDVRAAGLTPILQHQHSKALMIRQAAWKTLADIPECNVLPTVETVLIWRQHAPTIMAAFDDDTRGGVLCRAMLDWIRFGQELAQIWDIKTTSHGLSDAALSRAIVNNGYDLSAAFYLLGMAALFPDLAGRFKFRWIFVETEEPFEVRVIEADATTLAIGHKKANYAIEKWRRCLEADDWPGYPRRVDSLDYPQWAESAWLSREETEAKAAQ